jgi:hypothetical protein
VKVWLDDHRPARRGWVRAEAPEEVIALLREGAVTVLSLDHDLGLEPGRTGYQVLAFLEREVAAGWRGPLPEVAVHSANPVGRRRMLRALEAIRLSPRRAATPSGPSGERR